MSDDTIAALSPARDEALPGVDPGLAEACRAARLGAWRWDKATRRHDWSPALAELFRVPWHDSFTDAELLARSDPQDRDALAARLAALAAGTGTVSLAARLLGQDGVARDARFEGECRIAADGAVLGAAGFCQEVTARVQAEQALRAAERVDVTRQLTGSLAHDFNNLLTVISLNLEIAADMLDADDPVQEVLQPAIRGTESASAITQRLLAFARRKPPAPQLHDINRVIREAAARIAPTLAAPHRLLLDLQPEAGQCLIDAAGLETALRELVDNSCQAMPQGGTVTLSSARLPGPQVAVTVADTGSGIAPELRAQVLQPFFTTRKGARGAGLGLNLAQDFARHAGGTLELDSAAGRGTTVRLLLPAQGDAGAR
jgi:signal transduction histidine kinase